MNAQTKIAPSAKVYEKIAAVQGELAKVGIAKSGRNSQQGYNFRGIDAVYAALSPLLASHGLIIVPRMIERECIEGQTRKGDPLFRVTVRAEFDFIAAEDGSIHTAATFGEAMDSADKATNKAMSAAYKYAAFMTFAIPTEGDNDADATTPEVVSAVGSGKEHNGGRAASPTGPTNQAQDLHPDQEAAITKIIQLCEAVGGAQSQAICEHYKISGLRELTRTEATAVTARLEKMLADKAAAATDFGKELADEIRY